LKKDPETIFRDIIPNITFSNLKFSHIEKAKLFSEWNPQEGDDSEKGSRPQSREYAKTDIPVTTYNKNILLFCGDDGMATNLCTDLINS